MGLKLKKFINANGYEVENGYFEIKEVDYKIDQKVIHFIGDVYLSKDHKETGFAPIFQFEDTIELDESEISNITNSIYTYIKNISNLEPEEILNNYQIYKGFIGCEEV